MIEAERSIRLADLRNVAHGFYGRRGGVSTGLYDSLNCGLGSNDDRARVLENRHRVARDLLGPATKSPVLTAYQVHSAEAIIVTAAWSPGDQPKVDGLVTRTPGLILGSLAADCTPVLLADAHSGVVGALHAGWKGARAGIVKATVAKMLEAGAILHRITAAIGPTISQRHYEVGEDFKAQFVSSDRANARFFEVLTAGCKPHFDLPGYVELQLQQAGVQTIDRLRSCTYAQPERYYSYRRTTHRQEPDYGRQIAAIALR